MATYVKGILPDGARGGRRSRARRAARRGPPVGASVGLGPTLPLMLKLESRRYRVWSCPEALRDLLLALGGPSPVTAKTRTERLLGPGAP
jgi:hypothetical protein